MGSTGTINDDRDTLLAATQAALAPGQATALQQVAYDELMATPGRPGLKPFAPLNPAR